MSQMPAAPDNEKFPIADDNAAETTPKQVRVCRICLHSDIEMVPDVDNTLLGFYDELLYYDIYENEALSYCNICVHQLRKFYNYRQKCRRAHILLKNKGAVLFTPIYITNLTRLLPQSSIGNWVPYSRQKVYHTEHPESNENLSSNEHLELKENPVKIAESLPECSNLIKNPTGNGFFKYEAELLQSGNKTQNLKTYIQDFLKHEDTIEHDYEDVAHVAPLPKLKRKRIRPKRPKKPKLILSKSEKNQLRHKKLMQNFKVWVVRLLKKGDLDGIEDLGVKISEEVILKILDKCSMGTILQTGLMRRIGAESKIPKLRVLIESLLKRYNPLYEDMFEVTYLNTYEKQLEEFNARKDSEEYKQAVVKCDICYQVFELKGLLDFHMKWHEVEGNPSVCRICSMRFTSDRTCKSHIKSAHKERFICKLCKFSTYNVHTMRVHYRDHKGLHYKCPDCDKHFTKQHSMFNHFRYMHRLCTMCTYCGKRLLSEVKLKRHIETEHSNLSAEVLASTPTESCPNCTGVFHSAQALQYHATTAHRPTYNDEQNASYTCFVCKIDFETVQALYDHKRTEDHRNVVRRGMVKKPPSNRRTHRTCPLCHVEVLNEHPRSLFEHYRALHPAAAYRPDPDTADTQGFLCEHCGMAFKLKHVYDDHLNCHTGVKPYECSECGARFAHRAKAHMHLRQHRRVKRPKVSRSEDGFYICEICSKQFKNRANLDRHTLVHTGERPFPCPMCDKSFAQQNTMKLHVTTVHLKLPAPYPHFRSGVATTSKEPLGPPLGPVPPVSIELLKSCVLGPWKKDLNRLKALLDANVMGKKDDGQEIEELKENVEVNGQSEQKDMEEEVYFDTDGEMEEVVEETHDSEYYNE